MKYYLYLKSGCDAPDYEDEVEASSRKEAGEIFAKRINQHSHDIDWLSRDLMKDIFTD
jgi:hypothetical protein